MSVEEAEILAKGWLENFHDPLAGLDFDEACFFNPDLALAAILVIVDAPISDEVMSVLAAGPLESLLVRHGQTVIGEIEKTAAQNAKFKHLLGGVWKNLIDDEVWDKICRTRGEVW